MKAAIYARCASEQGSDMAIRVQLQDCHAYAVNQNIDIIKEYVDSGVSGITEERPALQELLSAAQKHLFDAVIIQTRDRMSRFLAGYQELSNRLAADGIEIRSVL